MSDCIQYQVTRGNIAELNPVREPLPDPATLNEGQVLYRIDAFALTANNVTYAAAGDMLRYWSFFPLAEPARGLVPVWGFATVVQTRNAEIGLGERAFGFWPMASHLVVSPDKVSPAQWTDGAEHRRELPVIYNRYRRIPPDADRGWDAHLALLYPLWATSWLLKDFMTDSNWFEAQQLIVASASSKTAIGLLKLAAWQDKRPSIIGLTSQRNADFVRSLDCCDQVLDYQQIEQLEKRPSVFVDIAGNIDTRQAIHQHLGDHLRYSCAVGTSHWDKFRDGGPMPGAKPQFFFAPAQSEKRREQWGAKKLADEIDQAWLALARDSKTWLDIETLAGESAVISAWQEMVRGDVSPNRGLMLAPETLK